MENSTRLLTELGANTYWIFWLTIASVISLTQCNEKCTLSEGIYSTHEQEIEKYRDDWQFFQRAYPTGRLDHEANRLALAYRQEQVARQKDAGRDPGSLDMVWEFAGPTNIGGRVTDIEKTTGDPALLYVGAASGGIFRTSDEGSSWESIFDEADNVCIGDIALAPSDERILYVGTGEPNAGGGSIAYDGNGVYRSDDGGGHWTHLGLDNIGGVGRIVVDARDPNRCLVGAMGRLYQKNGDRGIYRTNDGGQSWEQVLFINDSTGIIDMVVHPDHPDTIYAAAWQRLKKVTGLHYGGPGSGIYRTYDGGDTWKKLAGGLPESSGRIGLAISRDHPEVLVAYLADEGSGGLKGLYKTSNGGDKWAPFNKNGIVEAAYMYWYGRIYLDPVDTNTIYVTSLDMYKTVNGGTSWDRVFKGAHVDHHCLWIDPANPGNVYNGNDGGLYFSPDKGAQSVKISGLPITQFYTCEIDYTLPHRLYGGTQDNSSMRTTSGQVNTWNIIYGGDGFVTLVDPVDNTYVYTESQYGGFVKSTNGGASFGVGGIGIEVSDRRNWNSPFIIDPNDPTILYFGTHRLYKTIDRAELWFPISEDLTTNPPQNGYVYGTITTISASSVDDAVIYVGTDDGKVQRTLDGGEHWTDVSPDLPNRWVTSVTTDPLDAHAAYATFSGYRYGENLGHIFRTIDDGESWIDISGDFPDIPVNDLLVIPDGDMLCIATDIGVYVSRDAGLTWELMGEGLPNLIITDIVYHGAEKLLVAATYGRGLYKIDLHPLVATHDLQPDRVSVIAFPNPCKDHSTLQFTSKTPQSYQVSLYNTTGNLVWHDKARAVVGVNALSIDVASLSEGLYVLDLQLENHSSGAVSLMKVQ